MTARHRAARRLFAATLPALALALGPACSDSSGISGTSTGGEEVLVVASTSILGDVTREVVGDHANVEVLIGRGTDPHAFEPSARQAAGLREADLVVTNGLGLEPNLEGPVANAAGDGIAVFELAEEVGPVPFEPGGGELDPHVWFDPLRMADGVEALAGALDAVAPDVDWQAAAEQYAARLLDLHREAEALVATVPPERRVLVTNHEVLGYFAQRYGFEVLAAVIPGGSTLSEPSPADLADLVRLVRDQDVPAIFAETSQPARLAETLQREVGSGVEVVTLFTESLGEPGSVADSYVGMMRENARRITEALAP